MIDMNDIYETNYIFHSQNDSFKKRIQRMKGTIKINCIVFMNQMFTQYYDTVYSVAKPSFSSKYHLSLRLWKYSKLLKNRYCYLRSRIMYQNKSICYSFIIQMKS